MENKTIYIPDTEECKAAREVGKIDGLLQNHQWGLAQYGKGLNDAWECAKRIAEREDEMREIFHDVAPAEVFAKFSPSEVMAKIKEYETDHKLHVGDEIEIVFTDKTYRKAVIVNIDDLDCLYVVGVCKKNNTIVADIFSFGSNAFKYKKTGRHFSQIQEILEQLAEEEKDNEV